MSPYLIVLIFVWDNCRKFEHCGAGETKNSVNLPNEKYSAENVVWQIVKYFASQDDDSIPSQQPRWEMCGPWVSTCKRQDILTISELILLWFHRKLCVETVPLKS